MQTFLTYKSFKDTAKSLDNKRLGKQRVEALQILSVVQWYANPIGKTPAYFHHPACLQWIGHEGALRGYLNAMIDEWVRRGFKNNMKRQELGDIPMIKPWWMESPYIQEVNRTHRQRLMQKDLNYYAFGRPIQEIREGDVHSWLGFSGEYDLFEEGNPIYDPTVDYYWPVRIEKKTHRIAKWNPDGTVMEYINFYC